MFQSNAFQADAFQRHQPEVVAPPGGGGAGIGGGRRQFPFPNRYDDPEIFDPAPKIPEEIPRYVEGDPASAVTEGEVEPTVRARAEGPTSLTDLGRAPRALKAPQARQGEETQPAAPRARAARTEETTTEPAQKRAKAVEVPGAPDDLDARIERVMTKVLAKHRAENEPEDEEERELRLLRQLGFLN